MKEPWKNSHMPIAERIGDLINRMTIEEKASQLLHDSPAIDRLGIPAYNWWNECLHGVARAGKATVFPQAIALAATFDPTLIYTIATAISDEGRAKFELAIAKGERGQYRGITYWTPNVNIFRDPRWGRGQETYGEDPFLSGEMGTAMVRGLQQKRDGILKSAACAKHFVAHSGPEGLRHEFDATVSVQDLKETYLPAFKKLVQDGEVEAVMGAYNRVNGEPCCGSAFLLDTILRKEWKFSGHVVSDCWAIRDFHMNHFVTESPAESAALAIKSGCDLNCGCTYTALLEALEKGYIDIQDIEKSLERILTTRYKLGLFDPQETNPWKDIDPSCIDSFEHRSLALHAAEASFVLVKNSGVLPLPETIRSLYVIGPTASNPQALYGNYYGLNGRMVTFLEGLIEELPEGVRIDYRPGTLLEREKPNPIEWALGESEQADVTLACFGLDNSLEGEEGDAVASEEKGDRTSIELPSSQIEYLQRLRRRCKKLVVVLSTGSALAIPELHALADAILIVWYPGEEGGTALARTLFGKHNPSGSLPVTWYRSTGDLPPYDDYSMNNRTYRYCTKEPLYPFGFGLSYTTFTFSSPLVSTLCMREGDSVEISCTVTNTGDRAGGVTAQCYLIPPSHSERFPICSLKGFRKEFLEANESCPITFTLTDEDFSLFDHLGDQVILKGTWRIEIGNCSPSSVAENLGAAKPISIEIQRA